jgi:hypothetical protein
MALLTLAATTIAIAEPATPGSGGAWEVRDYVSLISAVTAVVAVVFGYPGNLRTLQASLANTEASIWQKANEVELKAIQEQLDEFFGPFMQMSGVNRLLSRDLRERQRDSGTFLLIEKLFDRDWLENLPKGEQAIVGEIAANAKVLREFIAANAKMGNLKIQPYLSRVSAHYRILELAYEQKLGDDAKPFVNRYVFPSQIDEVLALEVERLEKRRELLRSHPARPTPPSEELVIPDRLALKEWANPRRESRPELNVRVS